MPTRPRFLPYANFLMEIPSDFTGVADVEYSEGQLVVREDGDQGRALTMEGGRAFCVVKFWMLDSLFCCTLGFSG